MSYIQALGILPDDLIKEIQKYIDGQVIYIPKVESKKCKWGEKTNSKRYFAARNLEIYNSYQNGNTILELSQKYYLTPKSIKRIIRNINNIQI